MHGRYSRAETFDMLSSQHKCFTGAAEALSRCADVQTPSGPIVAMGELSLPLSHIHHTCTHRARLVVG